MPEDFEQVMQHRLEQFDRLVGECRELFEARNRGYRDALAGNGVSGVLYEWQGIAGRLRALREQLNHDLYNEPLTDGQRHTQQQHMGQVLDNLHEKFMDSVNYGLIGLMLIEDENYTGR